jgi:TPR repeat protein
MIAIGGTVAFYFLTAHDDALIRGDQPYQLAPQELSMLRIESTKGNCAAAYRVAQYHLYSSLDLQQAEKYYRLAAKCPNPDALTGLIIVLRKPEDDPELDEIIVSLRKLNPKMGESASIEVTNRRAYRTSK